MKLIKYREGLLVAQPVEGTVQSMSVANCLLSSPPVDKLNLEVIFYGHIKKGLFVFKQMN